MCVEILAESTNQTDYVKYSILLDADDRSKVRNHSRCGRLFLKELATA